MTHIKSLQYLNKVQPYPDLNNTWTVVQHKVQNQQTQSSSCCRWECQTRKICSHTYIGTCNDDTL